MGIQSVSSDAFQPHASVNFGFDGVAVEPYDFEVLYDDSEEAALLADLRREWRL